MGLTLPLNLTMLHYSLIYYTTITLQSPQSDDPRSAIKDTGVIRFFEKKHALLLLDCIRVWSFEWEPTYSLYSSNYLTERFDEEILGAQDFSHHHLQK